MSGEKKATTNEITAGCKTLRSKTFLLLSQWFSAILLQSPSFTPVTVSSLRVSLPPLFTLASSEKQNQGRVALQAVLFR